jgi:LysM repeat protein
VQVGDIGNNGPSGADYAAAIAARSVLASSTSPWANATSTYAGYAQSYADFSQGYTPIGATESASASSYVVVTGDTLRAIAAKLWGDENLWYLIADANGLNGTETLAAGQTLSIPARVTNVHQSSSTFRVYDPNKAVGDVQPTTPPPPPPPKKHDGCGSILLVIIAVVVIAITRIPLTNLFAGAGWTAAAGTPAVLGTAGLGAEIAGAAAAGALGSIASQSVGVATGIQDKFDWKGVALSAISAGVGGGLGKIVPGAGIGAQIGRAVAGNVITQGIAVATGLQSKFDWTGVAVSAVSAGVGGLVGQALNYQPGLIGDLGNDIKGGLAGAAATIASAATRSLIDGSDFGDNITAALPDVIGQTIGNAIAGGISRDSTTTAGQSEHHGGLFGAIGDFLGFDGQFGYQGPDGRQESLGGLGYAIESVGADIVHGVEHLGSEVIHGVEGLVGDQSVVVTADTPKPGAAGSAVTGTIVRGASSTLTGLALTKDQYLDAVKNGLWGQIQGNPNLTTGFSNNDQVAAAARKAQALPSVSTSDLQSSPDLASFVEDIGPATATAKIGGSNQRYEKFLTFGRNGDGAIVVTGISLVGPQGGNIAGLLTPDVIGIAHVHYQGLVQPPNSGDNSIAKARNLPSFVIGSTGRNVWEIGRVNTDISIRSVLPHNTFGPWEKYQPNGDDYRIYNADRYP